MEGYRRAGERRCGNGGGGGKEAVAATIDAASAEEGGGAKDKIGEDEDDEFIGDLTMIDSDDVVDDGRRTGQGGWELNRLLPVVRKLFLTLYTLKKLMYLRGNSIGTDDDDDG